MNLSKSEIALIVIAVAAVVLVLFGTNLID
jgi:hypothetical protein